MLDHLDPTNTSACPNHKLTSLQSYESHMEELELLLNKFQTSQTKISSKLLSHSNTTPLHRISNETSRKIRQSHSSPSIFTDLKESSISSVDSDNPNHETKSTPSVVKHAIIAVTIYISVGILAYMAMPKGFEGHSTIRLVDALYFVIVTLSTIGYGDIVPCTSFTKIFTCFFILIGFGFVDILLNGLMTYLLDKQEQVLLATMDENRLNVLFSTYIMDEKKRRVRVRMRVALAIGVVVVSIAVGSIMVHLLEGLCWVDSFYFSVISVTTVGYGDYSFSTMEGRLFATFWLLISSLSVTRAFIYLTELRIERRNRKVASWVLRRKITTRDLAEHIDNDGSISKSDFIIYKLKEMGKITENDLLEISDQFDALGC